MKLVKKIIPFHTDDRGEMSYLLEGENKITSAILITSKKGSLRANHYHKKDSHYCYIISGKMEYAFYHIKSRKKIKKTIIAEQGDIIYTPPMTPHSMRFLENTMFLALTTEPRSHDKYEKDTVRINLM